MKLRALILLRAIADRTWLRVLSSASVSDSESYRDACLRALTVLGRASLFLTERIGDVASERVTETEIVCNARGSSGQGVFS